MRTAPVVALLLAASLACAQGTSGIEAADAEDSSFVASLRMPREPRPLPPGTQELRFSDLYRLPVGRFGLEPGEKLLGLNEKKVRIIGYMVHQEGGAPGVLILAARRLATAEISDGMADDLPPAVVFVHLPAPHADASVPYTPAPLLIEGRLSVGPREEADGRISHVRIFIDPFSTATKPGEQTP